MRIPILYQDDDLIVVNKPVGMPTHAADPADPCPADALRVLQAQTGLPYLGMHQRLDADTSGVLLFSARQAANRALAAAFEGHTVQKVYLALVWGTPRRAEGLVDAPLTRDRDGRYRVTSPTDLHGVAARTRYRVLGRLSGADLPCLTSAAAGPICTLLEVHPETGRTHQIRLHLAHIGCPVVGDPLYGPPDRPAPRLALHAWQLTLPHPTTGAPITFSAPPPSLFGPIPVASGAPGSLPPHGSGPTARATLGGTSSSGNDSPRNRRAGGAGAACLRLALERRAPLAADPATTLYRLVHGAGDGQPGLTVDRYGDVLVANLYDVEADVADLARQLRQISDARSVYVKHRPRQASRMSEEQMAEVSPPRPVVGPDLAEFVAHEDGLAYVIRPGAGLSVGIFPDMREGRARVRAWAAGRRVLNCFAYTCGFGVAATAGGAARVLNLDLSRTALDWGQENYRANGFTPDPHDFVFGDVFDWLARLARRPDRFDLVILDPPGFSRTKRGVFTAAQDYGSLAGLAAGVTAPDGLLLACCNVAELPWRTFRERVLGGLADAGRPAEVVGVYHEPALDFPTPPGDQPYLKLLAARLR